MSSINVKICELQAERLQNESFCTNGCILSFGLFNGMNRMQIFSGILYV